MNTFIWLYELIQFIVCALCLLLTLLLPFSLRSILLKHYAHFFSPIISRLLLPSYKVETKRQPLWKDQSITADDEEFALVFGGNSETISRFDELFQGLPLGPQESYERYSKPMLLFPISIADTEKEYLIKIQNWVLEYTQQADYSQVKNIRAIGHSIGGAILAQLTPFLLQTFPHAQITLHLDRTFNTLSTVVKGLHPYGGLVLEKTLGMFWSFDSQCLLRSLIQEKRLIVNIYQIGPDHVLKSGLLHSAVQSFLPKRWSSQIVMTHHDNRLHSAPFYQCFLLPFPAKLPEALADVSTDISEALSCSPDDLL